jgi:hypothetical protein
VYFIRCVHLQHSALSYIIAMLKQMKRELVVTLRHEHELSQRRELVELPLQLAHQRPEERHTMS